MIRTLSALAFLAASGAAAAASSATDFAIRAPDRALVLTPIVVEGSRPATTYRPLRTGLVSSSVAAIGGKWGRVTSTYRSAARNKRVGGVRNSYHLSGRAIDIARRAGVRHSDIAAAYRAAGYHLIESLDEGDHSHFAFGGGESRAFAVNASAQATGGTQWRMVYAPPSR